MAHLLVLVLDNLEQCPAVLEAWEEAGVLGVTMLESSGLRRLRGVLQDDLPLLPSVRDVLVSGEFHHRTLFAVLEDDVTLERAIAATERVIGDLSHSGTGLLFVVPVTQVLGLPKRDPEGSPA